jgi:hypothetical protein
MDSATCTREEKPINLHDIYQPTINNYDWLFTRIAKTDKGHLCLREMNLSFDDDYIGWRNSK